VVLAFHFSLNIKPHTGSHFITKEADISCRPLKGDGDAGSVL
jgi:hypothetical protein